MFRSQPRFFTAARKQPGALELTCKALDLCADVQSVDLLHQTALFYAAREGNVAVARLLISLCIGIDFADKRGDTALDSAIVHDRFEMVRLLTSMGAQINPLSDPNSRAMKALLKEVREKRGARETRKRKRSALWSACPHGQKRSDIVSWTYCDTEAEEPEILREDVTVIHENTTFCLRISGEVDSGSQENQAFGTSSAGNAYGRVERLCMGQVGTVQVVRILIFAAINI